MPTGFRNACPLTAPHPGLHSFRAHTLTIGRGLRPQWGQLSLACSDFLNFNNIDAYVLLLVGSQLELWIFYCNVPPGSLCPLGLWQEILLQCPLLAFTQAGKYKANPRASQGSRHFLVFALASHAVFTGEVWLRLSSYLTARGHVYHQYELKEVIKLASSKTCIHTKQ